MDVKVPKWTSRNPRERLGTQVGVYELEKLDKTVKTQIGHNPNNIGENPSERLGTSLQPVKTQIELGRTLVVVLELVYSRSKPKLYWEEPKWSSRN